MFVTGVPELLTSVFSFVWDIFQITWPGTTVPIFSVFAGAAIGYFLFKIIIQFISGSMFNLNVGIGKDSNFSANRAKDPNVSKKRKGDTK